MASVKVFQKLTTNLSFSLKRGPNSSVRRFTGGAHTDADIKKRALSNAYPKDVGIVAMDVYFPRSFVKQEDLEQHDKVSKGKYTVGLEQDSMAFCGDREDIYSMSLTAVHNLLEKYNIPLSSIGRLEVGTETVIDKSKSVKSVLMSLFEKDGHTNIEGIDTINACYGGTSALLNAVNWVESSAWDGRYALVVTGDIAVYAEGVARPTGGAGVVAMLIGDNAPIVMERGLRSSYFEHAWDFYKPNLESEYPLVDGKLSINCYLRALDNCYQIYKKRFELVTGEKWTTDRADFALFHSPFTKMVRKSFSRMYYNDFMANDADPKFASIAADTKKTMKSLTAEESYSQKDVQNIFQDLSKAVYKTKVEPSLLLPKQLGNSYTASIYTGLLSLIAQKDDNALLNKRLFMFSYGSGLAATAFSLSVKKPLDEIRKKSDVLNRLNQRVSIAPVEYSQVMKLREDTHSKSGYQPTHPTENLFPKTYYLDKVDDLKRRHYLRI
eukprot:TRINITY_DN406_c0_g1_i1.p1 TRINITY_DN406_c0_g1~~TRINITY_DN406_c0_g1_i1.p1  ORF type:complete len:495 (-),score=146.51 TRINITY_DN406_c0_g1_i1:65-1549(-)